MSQSELQVQALLANLPIIACFDANRIPTSITAHKT